MLDRNQLVSLIPSAIQSVELGAWGERVAGKVRDIYPYGEDLVLIATDRMSVFDRVVCAVPYKGQVLNQLSLWWFDQVRDLAANHVVAALDPNVVVARRAEALPIEVVVRGYITGVTATALWTLYCAGDRQPYGIPLPEGMKKNDKLPTPIITPTTKALVGSRDERLTREAILERRIVPPALWEEIEHVALKLFERGQAVASRAGLILVDTKYEFGLVDGRLTLIDEVHTPDSSRYWTQESYQASHGAAPRNFDKEFLREWYVANGYRGEGTPPRLPKDVIAQVAERYIAAYERLTRSTFAPEAYDPPPALRIAGTLRDYVEHSRQG
ncbi:MAG: phosphoribosylaminoimidazolesuccinocarboxamide synthase [Anaerolineae bacterium]|nr:phosphoribosylaminoimidazolesuccinocarboxamide synthase [Anaerolineae bacterium]NUQ02933.1 phosphoribosylaminoimidazolesuccinocarboxamide synthase [Anaerolineae bacterium]